MVLPMQNQECRTIFHTQKVRVVISKVLHDGEKDKEKLIKEAEDYLSKDKKKKPADLSPSALGFEYISLLVSLFNDVVNGKIT